MITKIYGNLTYNIAKLRKSSMFRNTMNIALGNIIAQLFSLIFVFINGRIYGPRYYGEFGVFTSTYTIVNGLVCLGLASAILTPKENKDASGIYKICLISMTSLSLFLLLIVLAVSPWIEIINVSMNYYVTCVLLAIALITNNLIGLNYTWGNREQAYKLLFWNPIITTFINFFVSFIIGFTEYKNYGLILGMIISQFAVFIQLFLVLKPLNYINSRNDLKYLLKQYSDFPKYQMTSNFIKGLSSNAPILMMSTFFGNVFLGQYSMGQRLLFMPIVFIGTALGQVHFKQATDLVNTGKDPGELTYKVIKTIIIICFVPFLIIGVFGDSIFKMFLGESWILSGELAKIRALEFLFTSMFFSTSYIFVVIKKQQLSLLYTIISLILNLLMIYIGGYLLNDRINTVILISLSNIILYIGFYLYAFKYTSFGIKPYLKFITLTTVLFIVLQLIGNALF